MLITFCGIAAITTLVLRAIILIFKGLLSFLNAPVQPARKKKARAAHKPDMIGLVDTSKLLELVLNNPDAPETYDVTEGGERRTLHKGTQEYWNFHKALTGMR